MGDNLVKVFLVGGLARVFPFPLWTMLGPTGVLGPRDVLLFGS